MILTIFIDLKRGIKISYENDGYKVNIILMV